MRRLFAILLILSLVAAVTLANASRANAAASCSKHIIGITGWSAGPPPPSDEVDAGFNYICSGSDYDIDFTLEYLHGTSWQYAYCSPSVVICDVWRPGGAWYTNGTQHGQFPNYDWVWGDVVTPANITGVTLRVRAITNFYNLDPPYKTFSQEATP